MQKYEDLYENKIERNVKNEDVDSLFYTRWSPRAFDKKESLSQKEIEIMVEAARWAPSSFNQQPWLFLACLREDKDFSSFVDCLMDDNQKWAKDASALFFLLCEKENGEIKYPVAELDCGSAWLSLALQARKMGLYAHAMAGIHKEKVYKNLAVSEKNYKVLCGIAVGKVTKAEKLPEDLQEKEEPSERKDIKEILRFGTKSHS